MVVLRAILFLTLAGCYEPDYATCTVTCRSDALCASDQVCGPEGLCAPAGVSCAAGELDAPAAVVDAPVDPPDPPPTGKLRISIRDQGTVAVGTLGSCAMMMCELDVPLGAPITLTATPGAERIFERWGQGCAGTQPTCVITPNGPMTNAEARFKRDD